MNERQLVYQARQAVYGLLQRLYKDAPDPKLYQWLLANHPFSEFPIVFQDAPNHLLEQLEQALLEATFEELRQDYIQLYVGPGRMEVPPWESVYRNDERRLFDQHTLQVRETYARHGMEFVKKNKTPEDHISIELEFMRIVTERLLKAIDLQDEKAERILIQEQLEFLNGHMLVWMPFFIDLTRKSAKTVFFSRLSELLGKFLNWDVETLNQMLILLPISDAVVAEHTNEPAPQ